MTRRGALWVWFGAMLSLPAWAQEPGPRGALLLGRPSGWGWSCPMGSAVLEEFNLAGIPLDVFDPLSWSTVDFKSYTMIFLEDCQDDDTYAVWNARLGALEAWVAEGGFLAVHATNNCGVANLSPHIPGAAQPVGVDAYANQGHNLAPNHPLMAGIPAVATGTELSHNEYTITGDPSDIVLLESTSSGHPLLFVRPYGQGHIVYGGLTYSFGQRTCGATAPSGQDAGIVLSNEVAWGSTFRLCGAADADGDGVGDGCDRCPGFDDGADADGDRIPDACDNCPDVAGWDPYDGDGDGHGALCDCDDTDDSVHPGADERCNGIDDNCDGEVDGADAVDAGTWWVDADGDGFGDLYIDPVKTCDPLAWFVDRGGDCNDAVATVHPEADELCDAVDQDCDGDPRGTACGDDEARSGCATVPTGAGGAVLVLAGLIARRRRRAG